MTNTGVPNTQNDRAFLWRWVLTNILGLPVLLAPSGIGYFLFAGVAIMADGASVGYGPYIFAAIILAMIGAILGAWLGFLQWIVLRKQMLHSGKWIALTALGMAIGSPLGVLLYAILFAIFVDRPDGAYFFFAYEYLAFGPALGLSIGLSQASLLKRWIDGAKWWTIALPIFFTLGMLCANINRVFHTFTMPIHGLTQRLIPFLPGIKSVQMFFVFEILTSIMALISVSLLTGILMNWLLRSQIKQELS